MAIPQIIKSLANDVRTKIKGKEVRESLAQSIEITGNTAEDAKQRSLEQTKRVDTLIRENPQPSEVVDARGEFDLLSYRLLAMDQTFMELNNDLEARGVNIRDFQHLVDNRNVVSSLDEGDWSVAIQAASDYLSESKRRGTIVFPPDGVYPYGQDIRISKNVSLKGYGSSLKAAGRNAQLFFEGDQNVESLIFDGGNLTGRGIRLIGDRVNFRHNRLKNIYADELTGSGYGLHVSDESNDSVIEFNDFENFSAAENGIEGDGTGSIQALWIRGLRATINNNRFRGMQATEDGDYIYLSRDIVSSNVFPFNKNNLANGYFGEIFAVIQDNVFYNSTKTPIKLQASGCIIEGNKIINDGVNIGYIFRGYSTKGNIIKNNTVYLSNAVIEREAFQFQFTQDTICEGNTIHSDSELFATLTNINNLIYNEGLQFEDNKLYLENYSANVAFYISGNRNSNIEQNKMNANEIETNYQMNADELKEVNIDGNMYYYNRLRNLFVNSIQTMGMENIRFKNNLFKIKELFGGTNYFVVRKMDGMVFENNEIQVDSDQTVEIIFEDCKDVDFDGNKIDGSVSVVNDSDNINIADNDFKKEVMSAVFVNTTMGSRVSPKNIYVKDNKVDKVRILVSINGEGSKGNVEITGNDVKEFTSDYSHIVYFDSLADLTQDKQQIKVNDNTPSRRFDYGYSNERPQFYKHPGYKFFDYNLGYEVTWNGTSWVNGIGELV